ncbi:DUF1214 domain-containing protein [Siculibacillus lacustris]|uniref:DUF1214 domain-containing protein n=1 Tax=Siculibacillus lacustris TaxID=1549641 RepID=A0A4Q9VX90_9HYPH|nr:DUF1214 domain-containing protein [Siculibacillus lacustris]TBW40998.1 DUF1214 domain-containing protein [Siculibacillus lacustris]
MRFFVLILLPPIVALALGLGSAWYMISAPHYGTVAFGAWRLNLPVDAETVDPYTRARIARTGEIVSGAGEGLVFRATQDDAGHGLDARCDYAVAGSMPSARLWTLSVLDPQGRLPANPIGRTHVHGREVTRAPDGTFEVMVSAEARPGLWLPGPASGAPTLVLRLYDTPVAAGTDTPADLPHVIRRGCR